MLRKIPKICVDCKHYRGLVCGKFYNTDIVTGEKSYYYARFARENEKKCGEDAIHFEKNDYKVVTLPYYFVKNNIVIIGLFGGVAGYCYGLHYLVRGSL